MSTSQEIKTVKIKDAQDWSSPISFATTFQHVYTNSNYNVSLNQILNKMIIKEGDTTSFRYKGAGILQQSGQTIFFTIPINQIPENLDLDISEMTINDCTIIQNGQILTNGSSSLALFGNYYNTGIVANLQLENGTAFPNGVNNSVVGISIEGSIHWGVLDG